MAEISGDWVIRVAFDDGEFRYYKRFSSNGPGDFTVVPGDAERYESESVAWRVAERLNLRYPRVREIVVEADFRSESSASSPARRIDSE